MAKKENEKKENFDTEDESLKKENVDEAEEKESEAKASDDTEAEDEAEASGDDSDNSDDSDTDKDESSSDNADEDMDSKSSKKSSKDKKSKHQKMIDDLNDRVMRQMAEFENFRKRSDKEKSQMYDMGVKTTIEKILPVVDNFERGLDSASEDDSFADGMKMIYKQLMTSLEDIGVKEIEAEGEEFNPDYHNAVMHVEDEELGENVVVEVLQKGYTYNDSVIRHAMVKVAN